jgi:hypothetical protein
MFQLSACQRMLRTAAVHNHIVQLYVVFILELFLFLCAISSVFLMTKKKRVSLILKVLEILLYCISVLGFMQDIRNLFFIVLNSNQSVNAHLNHCCGAFVTRDVVVPV